MKQYIVERVKSVADYIIDNNSTVRSAAKAFAVSKSTVHKDVSERLEIVDKLRFGRVKRVLGVNLSQRHIRGGIATQKKYRQSNSKQGR